MPHFETTYSRNANKHLMFLRQVEFWLAKNLLLTLHGHNLFLHQTNKFPWQKKVIIYSLGKGVCRCRQQKYYIKSIFIDEVNTHCTMLHLFDDLWLDKIIPKNNDEGRVIYGNLENKINTLYWPVENSIPKNNDRSRL
jgi:hypothetical protein